MPADTESGPKPTQQRTLKNIPLSRRHQREYRELSSKPNQEGFLASISHIATEHALANRASWRGLSKETVKGMLKDKKFPKPGGEGGITLDQYQRQLEFMHDKEEFSRQTIIAMIDQGAESLSRLSPDELAFLRLQCSIGGDFDRLYILQQTMLIEEPPSHTEAFNNTSPDAQFLYGMIQEVDGRLEFVPNAIVFKEQVDSISTKIDASLATGQIKNPKLIRFIEAQKAVLTCRELADQERLFHELDAAQIAVANDPDLSVLPSPMGETPDKKHPRLVIFENNLYIKDKREEELNGKIRAIIPDVVDIIRDLDGAIDPANPTQYSSPHVSEESSGVVSITAIDSGRALEFKPTARIQPENFEARLENGVVIIVNMGEIKKSTDRNYKFLQQLFGNQNFPDLTEESLIRLSRARALSIVIHEMAHSRSMDTEKHKRLKRSIVKEEGQDQDILYATSELFCDATMVAALPRLAALPELQGYVDKKDLITSVIGSMLFYLMRAQAAGQLDSYNDCLGLLPAIIKRLGVESVGRDKFTINPSDTNIDGLAQELAQISGELARDVYFATQLADQAEDSANLSANTENFLRRHRIKPSRDGRGIDRALFEMARRLNTTSWFKRLPHFSRYRPQRPTSATTPA